MKDRLYIALIAIGLAVIFSGCGQKSAGLQEGAVAPDTQLFENGMTYLEKNQYIKSRLSFQTLINTYPDSEYTPASFLAIADSYYEEGGTENLLQAESQYKDFLIFYPTHEMADDAQLKIAAINYRLMKPYDRDPTNAKKAEVEFKRFINNFPDSELAPTAREALREVEYTLAQHDNEIGKYYYKKRSWTAAEGRFKDVIEKYDSYGDLDLTLFMLAKSLEEAGRVTEATVYYAQVAREFPFSKHFEEAKEILVLLEQEVPEVDETVAAERESNRRVENFSVMDPLRSVWQVFTGRPDIYEIARKRAELEQLGGDAVSPNNDELNPEK